MSSMLFDTGIFRGAPSVLNKLKNKLKLTRSDDNASRCHEYK